MGKTFVTADTHFGHSNIIKYCGRPYGSVKQMDESLINNWNRTVGKDDTVIFLGDLAFRGRDTDWLSQLHGNIIRVRGNHDSKGQDSFDMDYEGENIHFTHWPEAQPVKTGKWNIHGHKHDKGQLIDINRRSMCVSTELTAYTPIELRELLKIRNEAVEDGAVVYKLGGSRKR